MIDTERKEDLFLDTKLIKSENRLGKLRIIDELHPVLGGQPTHEKDQPNDNNPFLDLACTMQFTIDKVNAVDKKADTKLAKAQNLKDVANVAIARDNLGLGTSSTMNATSTLSDRTDQTATIKVVNDVNRAANNAQTSANNANDKANAAQTRADSAYNLASKKRDKTDNDFDNPVKIYETGSGYSRLELHSNEEYTFLETKPDSKGFHFVTRKLGGENIAVVNLPRKSGTLALDEDVSKAQERADDAYRLADKKRDKTDLDVPTNKRPTYITFSGGDGDAHFGYSASMGGAAIKSGDDYYNFRPDFGGLVATTAEVNALDDTLIGVGQTWSVITNEIEIGVNYTNNSRRPIMINIRKLDNRGGVTLYVDNVHVVYLSDLNYSIMGSAIVPPNSTYRVELASSNNPGLIITAMR